MHVNREEAECGASKEETQVNREEKEPSQDAVQLCYQWQRHVR